MSTYQYRVVPAPTKGLKSKGIKGAEARFSNAIEELMNTMGAQGWEYQRAETLPSTERSGLTGSTTEWRNVLVFRKPRVEDVAPQNMPLLAAPIAVASTQVRDESTESESLVQTTETAEVEDDPHPAGGAGATQMLADNGVEETSEVAGMTDSLKALASRRSPADSDA
jgi:hypothetical protein